MNGDELMVCDGKCDNNDNGRVWINKRVLKLLNFTLIGNMVLK